MGFIFPQIKAFKQPSKFLQADGFCDLCVITRPGEFVTLQTLLPKTEAVAVPVQGLDLGAGPVGEDVQCAGKWTQTQFEFDQRAQAVDGFSEVNRVRVQVDRKRSTNPRESRLGFGRYFWYAQVPRQEGLNRFD